MTRQHDTQTLIESFSALADEVQNLIDRKTILEHKLRFAAEQYQHLADKYAPTAPEISDTLANLQLPPDLHKPAIPSSFVPLPKRDFAGCNQHQIALLIREGRRAAQQLSSCVDACGTSSKDTSLGTAITTVSTVMEQDFTVEGKKGMLGCPFSNTQREEQLQRQRHQLDQEKRQSHQNPTEDQQPPLGGAKQEGDVDAPHGVPQMDAVDDGGKTVPDADDPAPHGLADPICVAMHEEATSQTAPSSAGAGAVRCPIRYMDQHSPEEVAHYVETHKHQLPRSHAICLRRYQQNEQQIRKMDAKYGNLVNMISGLGQFHQPMLATAETGVVVAAAAGAGDAAHDVPGQPAIGDEVERAALHRDSHERVKTWAKGVSNSTGHLSGGADESDEGDELEENEEQRVSPADSRPDSSNTGADAGAAGTGVDAVLDDETPDMARESHFDRPLKEVRLGESPSRPWGISVPISSLPDAEIHPPLSPPAAPVRMPSPPVARARRPPMLFPTAASPPPARKCPFDHTKFTLQAGGMPPAFQPAHEQEPGLGSAHAQETRGAREAEEDEGEHGAPVRSVAEHAERLYTPRKPRVQESPRKRPMAPMSQTAPMRSSAAPPQPPQPAFADVPPIAATVPAAHTAKPNAVVPQMVFNGPVFIGYPMEQAIQFMQQFPSHLNL
ncbi:hypothetical protein SPI_00097 [Niveomyces insectorum RCEF 264]|uniref:Uncharacterized protein n=1 Tax=Niveomyces insectorum RCEF 264 TaxID=1081102 RepID=A0A162JEW3_9HYPO|nr:hypothetical protein SPI_00097 [Niveomyces insectorum RCEF 264]